jgi:fatty-acyl-CoA synthase
MQSTMSDFPLTITHMLRYGRRIHGQSEAVTGGDTGLRRTRFADVADRVDRLAAGLERLGIGPGDRVGTFCFCRSMSGCSGTSWPSWSPTPPPGP